MQTREYERTCVDIKDREGLAGGDSRDGMLSFPFSPAENSRGEMNDDHSSMKRERTAR